MARSNKAADVRKLVQQLNLTRGQMEEQYDALQAHQGVTDEEINDDAQDLRPIALEENKGEHARPSKWAAYDAIVQRRELQSKDESGASMPREIASAEGGEGGGSEFVTALPDSSVRKERKRQRDVKAKFSSGLSKPVGTKSRLEQNLFSGNADTDRAFGKQNSRTSKRSRRNLENVTNTPAQRDTKWDGLNTTQWDAFTARNRQESGDNDLSGGMLTSFGDDEVVHEETIA